MIACLQHRIEELRRPNRPFIDIPIVYSFGDMHLLPLDTTDIWEAWMAIIIVVIIICSNNTADGGAWVIVVLCS